MTGDLWDPADGPDPNGFDEDEPWADRKWRTWFDDHEGPRFWVPPVPRIVTIDPSPYL